MARKVIIDLDCESTVQWTAKGQMVEGYYLGFKNITTDFGKSKLHVFKGEQGNFGVYGSAKLDEKLGNVTPGNYTDITFEGKVKIPGGKTMKKFIVADDDENTIAVLSAPKSSNSLSSSSSDESEEDSTGSDDTANDVDDETLESLDEEDAPVPQRAPIARSAPPKMAASAAPVVANASAARASVESLLASRKR